MTHSCIEQRIRLLEDVLLWYVVRYGPTAAAIAAYKKPTEEELVKHVDAISTTADVYDDCHMENRSSQSQGAAHRKTPRLLPREAQSLSHTRKSHMNYSSLKITDGE